MATTQRIPSHPFRQRTIEIQATKNPQIAALCFILAIAGFALGCKSGKPAPTPFAFSSNVSKISETPASTSNAYIDLAGYQTANQKAESNNFVVQANLTSADQVQSQGISNPDKPADQNVVLSLEQVLESVTQSYPEIEIAIGEIQAAEGKIVSSLGKFDSTLEAFSISQPLGFYQNYQNGTGVTQPLWSGGEVYGTYRIGRGKFEPWYGERATDEGGELKAGFALPLLKGREIDSRRAGVRSAEAGRDQVEADVEARLLQFQRFATQAYWDWAASGRAVQIQQQLLALAQTRVSQINERVEKGDLATVAQIDNERFIAKRLNDLIKTRRSLEKSAIKLSLFYRDSNCSPVIAQPAQLPPNAPDAEEISDDQLENDIELAIAVRPELKVLDAARSQASIDLQYAKNLTLPKLDFKGYAAKDVGALASSLGDKRPFELQLGIIGEVPIQRREGLGKIRSADAKLTQIDAKSRFVKDKIRAEVQDAASAVNAAFDQIQQSSKNTNLARQSLGFGRKLFDAGDIDLIELNIYENSVADAELQLLDATFKYLFYRATYATAKSGVAFE